MSDMERLCRCSHGERDHLGTCYCCPCVKFVVDPRSISLPEHLETVAHAIEGALDELNTYKGKDRQTGMPVWVSGDDFRAYGELIDMLEHVEMLRGRLKTGQWKGRGN